MCPINALPLSTVATWGVRPTIACRNRSKIQTPQPRRALDLVLKRSLYGCTTSIPGSYPVPTEPPTLSAFSRLGRVSTCRVIVANSNSSSAQNMVNSNSEEEDDELRFLEDQYMNEEDEDLSEEESLSPSVGEGGYTPFEFIEFTNIPMKHEVAIQVDRNISDCYKVWDSRLNWMQWFDMIDEIGFHEEEPSYMSMYMWYRWATTPFLELYVTLERTQEEVNKYILEEPVEGFPLVAAVLFHAEEGETRTTVTLRLSYLLPKVLQEFAGQMAVYADVNKKLERCMEKMKSVVEAVDMDVLEEIQKENEQQIKANFVEARKQKQETKQQKEDSTSPVTMSAGVAAVVEEVLEEEVKKKMKRGGKKAGTKRNPSSSPSDIL